MSMPASGDLTTWTVTGQNEETSIQPGGNPVKGVRVFYTTGQGHTGSVFVPYGQYTTDNVRGLVAAAAAQMDAVGMLSSGQPAG